ncbi:2'-5' RNA ligase family protein [Streptomyces inhibens]|uniref:2'-5' RNA ligase family protein n=1 Tax=Streptomyces inhibens TaxID=2293571 RepID=UPI0037A00AED
MNGSIRQPEQEYLPISPLGKHRAFDRVLYLVPEPDAELRRLTEVIADQWPEAPPYGGQFTEIVPHLTVADGQDDAVLDEIESG